MTVEPIPAIRDVTCDGCLCTETTLKVFSPVRRVAMIHKETLGLSLRLLRKCGGITQKDLGTMIGVSGMTISNLENRPGWQGWPRKPDGLTLAVIKALKALGAYESKRYRAIQIVKAAEALSDPDERRAVLAKLETCLSPK